VNINGQLEGALPCPWPLTASSGTGGELFDWQVKVSLTKMRMACLKPAALILPGSLPMAVDLPADSQHQAVQQYGGEDPADSLCF
jgi:hypothetical protein